MSETPNFPKELYVLENEVECCSHMGHPDLVECAQQATMHDNWVQLYRKVGKPFQVNMENRQQHRVLDANDKPLTEWTTWESEPGPCRET